MRKWRKSNYAEPGQRVVHPGLIDDYSNQDANIKFGKSATESDHVNDVWGNPGMDSEYSQAKYSQKEALYHSTKQEPLGRSYVRGHVLPGKTTENDFKFGKASVSSTEAAKPLLYPTVTEDDQVRNHSSWLSNLPLRFLASDHNRYHHHQRHHPPDLPLVLPSSQHCSNIRLSTSRATKATLQGSRSSVTTTGRLTWARTNLVSALDLRRR